jgi:hypothetical protein
MFMVPVHYWDHSHELNCSALISKPITEIFPREGRAMAGQHILANQRKSGFTNSYSAYE